MTQSSLPAAVDSLEAGLATSAGLSLGSSSTCCCKGVYPPWGRREEDDILHENCAGDDARHQEGLESKGQTRHDSENETHDKNNLY